MTNLYITITNLYNNIDHLSMIILNYIYTILNSLQSITQIILQTHLIELLIPIMLLNIYLYNDNYKKFILFNSLNTLVIAYICILSVKQEFYLDIAFIYVLFSCLSTLYISKYYSFLQKYDTINKKEK